MPAQSKYEHRWGSNYRWGLGLPLHWFTKDQQRHLVANRMRNLPTMMVLVEITQRATCNNRSFTGAHFHEWS